MNRDSELKLVMIEWLDSHSGRGWQDIDRITDAAEPLHCRSVGWLVSRAGNCKVLVPHLSGEANGGIVLQGSGDITIPNSAIVKMKVIGENNEEDLHYTAAFGALPLAEGEEMPEDAIRRSRDGVPTRSKGHVEDHP